jgi:hypothetical protein
LHTTAGTVAIPTLTGTQILSEAALELCCYQRETVRCLNPRAIRENLLCVKEPQMLRPGRDLSNGRANLDDRLKLLRTGEIFT